MFSSDKITPKEETVVSNPTLFNNIRSSQTYKTRRVRQCFKCLGKIPCGDKYIKHEYRYDSRIQFVNFHLECY